MATQNISPSSSTYKIHHQPITLCIIGSACSNKRILSSVEDRYVYEYINDERQVICTLVETKILLSQRQLRIYIVDSFDVIDFSDFIHYLGESVRKDYSDQVTYVISHANIGEKYLTAFKIE
ncbi:unnamed protein product [Rotaria sordida]|uniref:Uncharacterized protein n=1 Tax=Rotaria sordida TaxID=392033 RepID=A0A818MH08_9BILA|nr:unnamed protein product [Rotaria sordida]